MDLLKFSSLAISEINFLHESSFDLIDHAWFLLVGCKQDQDDKIYVPTNANEAELQWYIEKVIRIPMQRNDQINQESLKKRINLTKVTQKDICILGILDLYQLEQDENINNEVTKKVLLQLAPLALKYLIKYNVLHRHASSQEVIDCLKGYKIEDEVQLGEEIIFDFLQDKVQIEDVNDRYQIITPNNALHPDFDEFQLIDMKDKEINIQKYNNNAIRKLLEKINRMIMFLKDYDANDKSFSATRDVILRKISMLVTQLKRGGTNDMNYLLDNKINEIKLLEISCKQWEISNMLKK
ncbi:Csi1p [Saccharomyces paradoxus]|uniref:Csi1p n=1 Tax=Saccharomyces paradoxus TaxID=27291 RepID=A0A8B8UXA4_SACPA|nr:Csi1 [Saccharomyces paradoxus]QHS75304.1 Csi1 [Saccharomyces paradoxus]